MVKQRQDISNSRFKPRYATFLMLAICFVMIFSISFSSAFLDTKGFDKNIGKYGEIKINNFLFFNKADYRLTDYGTSIINVWGEGEYTLYKSTHLFSGAFYKDIIGNKEDLKNLNFFIWEEKFETKYNPKYENQNCINETSINGTIKTNCDRILVSNESYQVDLNGWIPYKKGTKLETGNGKFRYTAERKINKPIDIILKAHGKSFTEWIWYNATFGYKRQISNLTGNFSYMNLTYDSDMQADFDDLRFTNIAETIELNYTISDKSDNNWVTIRVHNKGDSSIYMYYGNVDVSTTSSASDTYFEPVSYWYLDKNLQDSINANNLTDSGSSDIVGTIGRARDFNLAESDYAYKSSFNGLVTGNGARTMCVWYYPVSGGSGGEIAGYGDTGNHQQFLLRYDYTTNDFWANNVFDDLHSAVTHNVGNWYYVCLMQNGTNQSIWVDGDYEISQTITLETVSSDFVLNKYPAAAEYGDGVIDELIYFNYSLTKDKIYQLYTQNEPVYILGDEEASSLFEITSISPVNYYSSSLININFQCNGTDETGLYSLNLTINGSVYETVIGNGTTNLTLSSTETLSDGSWEWYCTGNDDTETKSSATRTLTINTTPDIQFVSPTQIDNYNSSSSIIPINVTLTETYFQNITFNVNGTEYTYTNETRYINNSYPDGNYTYNVTTCTTTNQCNTTETRTINIDAGKILTLSYPENNTIISNDTITFITILNSSDTSEEWINITYYLWNSDGLVNNETNIISGFNLTDNITFSNLTLRDYHWNALAWYGNPTHKDYMLAINGNFTFSIGGTVDEEIYENNTYETSSEIFSLNITLFEGVVVHAAYLYYDAIEYIGEITDLNNNQYSITKSIDVPLIDGGVENRSFHWSFIYTSPIQKTQNTTSKNQTVNPIFFGLCDVNYTVHALDINIKEEGTFDDLNGTLEFASEYWLGGGTVTKEYTYSYLENNISSYDFCISPTYKTFNIDDIISYTATDYDRRDYFLDNAELSNATMNLSLYLLQTATTDIFTVTVQDQDSKPVEGAFVNVQRWDIGTNNFYTIGMIKTTSDGTGIINSRLNDAWYRYQVIYNNILYLTTEPVKEAGTSRTLKINLEEDNPYNRFNDIDFSLTYDETTNISTFTFSDTTGAVAIGCLKVLKMEGNGTTEVYYSCVESASGTLSHQIEDDGTYIIRAIFKLSDTYDNIEQVVDEIIRQGTGHRFVTIGKFGQFISLMVVGTASMMGVATGSIPLGLGLIAVSLIVVNLLGWLNITSSVLYGIISIIILIAINLRRGK